MQVSKRSFRSLKREWEEIEKDRKLRSPFHSYAFAECLYKEYRSLCGIRGTPEFYCITENGKTRMICPVCREKHGGRTTYSAFGKDLSVVQEDFLYPDSLTDEKISECLRLLTGKLGTITFDHVESDSRLYRVALQNGMICREGRGRNGWITLPDTYDAYYQNLSKQTRATIRGAKNRLATDGVQDSLEIYYGKEMKAWDRLRFFMLYATSKNERFYREQNPFRKLFHWVYAVFFRHHARALNRIDASVCVLYRIDGKLAAVIGGYLDETQERVYWHTTGFDSRFQRYSPGIMVWQKTIEAMIRSGMGKQFDLTIGMEDYKRRIGCEEYADLRFCLAAQ